MEKTDYIHIRCTPEEKEALRAEATRQGWKHISELVRALVSQSEPRPAVSEQSQPGHHDDAPPL